MGKKNLSVRITICHHKVSFLKEGVLQLLKKNVYSVLILYLLKPLFSVFRVFQALSIFVQVDDLYIDDPLGVNRYRKYAYSSKTLLMNTLNSGRVNPSPPVCIGHTNVFLYRSQCT